MVQCRKWRNEERNPSSMPKCLQKCFKKEWEIKHSDYLVRKKEKLPTITSNLNLKKTTIKKQVKILYQLKSNHKVTQHQKSRIKLRKIPTRNKKSPPQNNPTHKIIAYISNFIIRR